MSGEHTHPDMMDEHAILRADLLACAARLRSLEGAVAELIVQVEALEAPAYDYEYLGKPSSPQTIGRTWTRLDLSAHDPAGPGWSHSLMYLNITPTFRAGKEVGALRPRLVRADGDMTAYDDILVHVDALDGDGVSCRNRLYWESGDGTPTYLELRCIGGLASVVLNTRYRKVCTIHR